MTFLANHLWQSTLFAAFAALLAFALRRNSARVRHWIWLAASLKFLIPFSLLISAGGRLPQSHTPPPPQLSKAVDQISRPFAPPVLFAAAPTSRPFPRVLPLLWLCGSVSVFCFWFVRWRRTRMILRAASPLDLSLPIHALSSPVLIEPGVFGVFRPVLLLPDGITDRLTSSQLRAVIAHELCHVRRRDNLAAAFHMAVEGLFWFHPLVWWIGARLVDERERACDESVLSQGGEPETYAEGILSVCRFYLESPLPCASGVTGADLRKRIESIMTAGIGVNLSMSRKVLLATTAIASISLPLAVGILHAQTTPAFEVASVKPNTSADPRPLGFQALPGGALSIKNVFLRSIISEAYGLPFFNSTDRLTGTPPWIDTERYDIDAKAPAGTIPPGTPEWERSRKTDLMLQSLLADRFKLAIHRETKELPVYELVVLKSGLKLPRAKKSEKDCPEISTRENNCHGLSGGQGGGIQGNTITMAELVDFLQMWTDRPLIDKTGVTGLYDIDVHQGWVPMRGRPAPPPGREPTAEDIAFADPTRPTLNTVLGTIGLKLEPTKGPVEIFVVDHIEHPSAN
jgi:uncharacterized protein (TIGR03435 family)